MTTTANGNTKTFVSSKGIELVLRPVSQFKLDSLRASAEEIPVPQYEMTIVGGEKILHPMDATIAQNQNRMDEWNEYLKAKSANERDKAKRFTDLLLFDGVELDVPGEDSDWQRTSEAFGIKIPTDHIARKLHYIYTEALVGQEDITSLVSQILEVSQMDEEVVRKIRDSFRAKAKRHADQPVRPKNGKMAVK
jgi:hypothetical protein